MAQEPAMFWSGETLTEELKNLIDPFDPDKVDCSAYTLSIGPEFYVSPNEQSVDPENVTIQKLSKDESFTIPPDQFAFLLTEEVVHVPPDAMAFISIRTRTKFRGLVNVSGFHVDPGFRGQLTFAVFNASPVIIHLKRGQPIFLIWYAGLDRRTTFRKDSKVQRGINPDVICSISGPLLSFSGLSKKIEDVESALKDRIHVIEKAQAAHRIIWAIILTIAIGLATAWLKDWIPPYHSSNQSTPTGQEMTVITLSTVESGFHGQIATPPQWE